MGKRVAHKVEEAAARLGGRLLTKEIVRQEGTYNIPIAVVGLRDNGALGIIDDWEDSGADAGCAFVYLNGSSPGSEYALIKMEHMRLATELEVAELKRLFEKRQGR